MKIGLVILNRNEAQALPVILPMVPRHEVDLVFAVDGHSTDGSPEILHEHGIQVIEQRSVGRGEAFKAAFVEADEQVDALIFFSPDGNEDPDDIRRFRQHLEDGADMVIATRMTGDAHNEEDVHWFRPRKWANLAFNWIAWIIWGRGQRRITDGINGFRAITVDAWQQMGASSPGFTIEYQTTIRAYKRRLDVREFATHEGQRIGGESGARSIRTGMRFSALVFRELFQREPKRASR